MKRICKISKPNLWNSNLEKFLFASYSTSKRGNVVFRSESLQRWRFHLLPHINVTKKGPLEGIIQKDSITSIDFYLLGFFIYRSQLKKNLFIEIQKVKQILKK